MSDRNQDRGVTFGIDLWATIAAFAIGLLMILIATQSHAQSYTVLHNFTDGSDGGEPVAGLTIDAAGNLYGTTYGGGSENGNCFADGCGVVFKLKRTNSGWVFAPLYVFQGKQDGTNPTAPPTLGHDGSLYGTASRTYQTGCGVVYNLKPPPAACKTALCAWSETIVYTFHGYDGCGPYSGVIFDQSGDLYGTTVNQADGYGDVYELSPSNGTCTATVLHAFTNGDGAFPTYGNLVFDPAGNLYGTTAQGGPYNEGTVFQLVPSGSAWTLNTLYNFQNASDGAAAEGGVILDSSGNLYGANVYGGSGGGGTVYELSPLNGSWVYALLASLTSSFQYGAGPWGSLVMDKTGNLYGTMREGGIYTQGTVFKLTPYDGGWTYTSLHDFACPTGCGPYGSVVFDADGNLYGTAGGGGSSGYGVIWEITP